MVLQKKYRFLFSLFSGILLVLSFPFSGSLPILAFIAWVPLLLVENAILIGKYRSIKVFIHAYLTFLVYNIGTTWWIYHASPGGAYLAFILNSLLMALAFYFYHLVRKIIPLKWSLLILIICWIGFEHLHYHWELSWPWLTLGNIFSRYPHLVQWYEYTGVMGGSLWLLVINYLVFSLFNNWKSSKKFDIKINRKVLLVLGVVIIIPVCVSLLIYVNYEEDKNPVDVVVVQPNVDPYNEKFVSDSKEQIQKMLFLAQKKISNSTNFVLFPETAISSSFDERSVRENPSVNQISEFIKKYPKVHFLSGASTYAFFDHKESIASRLITETGEYIEFYNSSLAIDRNMEEIVHKSKLVLGVEKIPFAEWFPFLEELSINNGGTSGTLGQEKEAQIISSENGKYAPVVCYESIYGEFIGQQVRKGAELIFIITNDGWWKDTPGYKQHNSFATLRAIETRRSIARSGNTGISSLIDQRGDIIKKTGWWTEDVINMNLNKNSRQTFYVRFGDLWYRMFSYMAVSLAIFVILVHPIWKMINIKKEPSQ